LILILFAVLVVVVSFAIKLGDGQPTQPPQMQSAPPTGSSANSEPSSVPTVPPVTQPVTQPPATKPGVEYIGNLYTREELEALPSKSTGYGPGKHVDSNNRPTYAISLDKQYEKYDAHYICPDDGKFYLTYNVTYEHEGLVQKTLNTLKAKNVQCVIFIDKAFVRDYPHMVRQILNDGHILANHCTTHPDLPTLSIDKIVDQIMDVHNYVKETYGYEMKLFRPPSGYFSEQVWAIAQSLGYRSYNFSFTHLDYDTDNQPDRAQTLEKMTNAIHSGAIYQLHAISSTNEAILADFIDAVRAKGLEFALLP
jgi:peptidoglycan-N-acetylmuramic acid deacetylase